MGVPRAWSTITASSVLAGARTYTELTWPNGPMVAVGHMRHNQKPNQCPNHSGGDNHREKAVRCGDLTSSLERGPLLLGWRDPQRCVLSLSPSPSWRGREAGRFASCAVSTLWPEMVENRHRHASIIRIVTPQRRGQRKTPIGYR